MVGTPHQVKIVNMLTPVIFPLLGSTDNRADGKTYCQPHSLPAIIWGISEPVAIVPADRDTVSDATFPLKLARYF